MSARMIVEVANGKRVLFGKTDDTGGLDEVSGVEHLAHVTKEGFASAMGTLTGLLETLQHAVEQMPKRPEKVELEFSASLTGKGELWVVSGEAEAEFKVTLAWGKSD